MPHSSLHREVTSQLQKKIGCPPDIAGGLAHGLIRVEKMRRIRDIHIALSWCEDNYPEVNEWFDEQETRFAENLENLEDAVNDVFAETDLELPE